MHHAQDPAVAKVQRQLLRQDFIDLVNKTSAEGNAATINEALSLSLAYLSTAELIRWFEILQVRWHVTALD